MSIFQLITNSYYRLSSSYSHLLFRNFLPGGHYWYCHLTMSSPINRSQPIPTQSHQQLLDNSIINHIINHKTVKTTVINQPPNKNLFQPPMNGFSNRFQPWQKKLGFGPFTARLFEILFDVGVNGLHHHSGAFHQSPNLVAWHGNMPFFGGNDGDKHGFMTIYVVEIESFWISEWIVLSVQGYFCGCLMVWTSFAEL